MRVWKWKVTKTWANELLKMNNTQQLFVQKRDSRHFVWRTIGNYWNRDSILIIKKIELLQNLHLSEINAENVWKKKMINKRQSMVFSLLLFFYWQAILIAPDGEVSSFYYKRQLATYNFTIYNMKNGEGMCYVCNETIANLGAN